MISTAKPAAYSIGEVSEAAGVSVQTLRLWELRGHIEAGRTTGGQRTYTKDTLRKAVERATSLRRNRKSFSKRANLDEVKQDLVVTGARIKGARLARGFTQAAAAAKIGISRSFLATVEQGESGVSVQTLARMSDVFDIPMSSFAGAVDPTRRIMRAKDRPRTVLGGGVTWEELAQPGSFDVEPALLYVPAGQDCGGMIVRPGEGFAFVMKGRLTFEFGDTKEIVELKEGDAVIVKNGTPYKWRNTTKNMAVCIWLELIAPLLTQKKKTTRS
jgi:transcriptional regulator with XRE-family HTH domain